MELAGILLKYTNKMADAKNISRDSKSFDASKVRNANSRDQILSGTLSQMVYIH